MELDLEECEVHVDRDGVLSHVSGELHVDSDLVVRTRIDGEVVDDLAVDEPRWDPESIQSETIGVEATNSSWTFVYDNGARVDDHLRVPIDRFVTLEGESREGEHVLNSAGLRLKMAVDEGEFDSVTLSVGEEQIGSHDGYCSLLHEGDHGFDVTVLAEDEYDEWKAGAR